jgi:hypothetical protein
MARCGMSESRAFIFLVHYTSLSIPLPPLPVFLVPILFHPPLVAFLPLSTHD